MSSVSRLNNFIQKAKADAMDIIIKLNEAGKLKALSIGELRDKIAKKNVAASFLDYTNELVSELKSSQRFGTARSYKGVHDVLKAFNGNKDLNFQDIDYKFLTKLEAAHLGNGNSYNGLAVYMRTIRAIFNKAAKAGVIEKEIYPFSDYKIRTQPTEKRALDFEPLKKIITLQLPPGHICFDTRNYFVASYMMYGMNFTDMAFIRAENIVDGRLRYRRKKTGKLYDIKITEDLHKILSYYIDHAKEREFIFPIIKRQNVSDQDKDVQWSRKVYNKRLKKLAAICGIEENLTSYVSRHSFATRAMLSDIPLNAISDMLGHSNLKTTQVYLKGLSTDKLDEYNLKILT